MVKECIDPKEVWEEIFDTTEGPGEIFGGVKWVCQKLKVRKSKRRGSSWRREWAVYGRRNRK